MALIWTERFATGGNAFRKTFLHGVLEFCESNTNT
jgi:hypothetical protein